ncbi:MAG: hypothetical protein KGJ32_01485 [Xanthomonadaceae bacterium]|nr:hypothetical protein [Xanthomonadaceae bacterium]
MNNQGKTSWDKAMAPHVVGSGVSQAGFQSRKGVKTQGRISYAARREKQFFRQMATRLFYHAAARAKKKGLDAPVEVQMMYAGGNIFIGSNRDHTAESIGKALKYQDLTRRVLSEKAYFASTKSTGGRITSRHAHKLASRMFDDSGQDKWVKAGKAADKVSRQGAALMARMVRDIEPDYLDPGDKKSVQHAFGSTGGVYILHSGFRQEGRHVEEKFMDMLGLAGHKGRTIVGGKMRPCLTCSGRMQHMNDQGHDVAFGQEPGKVWKGRYEDQPHEVRKVTASLAASKFTWKSKAGWGYDAESDSDSDG